MAALATHPRTVTSVAAKPIPLASPRVPMARVGRTKTCGEAKGTKKTLPPGSCAASVQPAWVHALDRVRDDVGVFHRQDRQLHHRHRHRQRQRQRRQQRRQRRRRRRRRRRQPVTHTLHHHRPATHTGGQHTFRVRSFSFWVSFSLTTQKARTERTVRVRAVKQTRSE